MRLLMIQGDHVGVYEAGTTDRRYIKQLAIFAGADQLDAESAEQLRLTPKRKLEAAPLEKEGLNGSSEV